MKYLCFLFSFLFLLTASAQISLGPPFSDHMVLQRNSTTTIWGWTHGSGQEIEITTSWNQQTYTTKSNQLSKWTIQIPTPEAGGPYEITINKSIQLSDVMIGEVWLCSGQSNMEWSARVGIDNTEEAIKMANNQQIRFFTVPKTGADQPQNHCDGEWLLCSPETMSSFSAVAYFFGKELQERLQVPVGLINSSWGGTPAEVWTPGQVMATDSVFANWDDAFSNAYRWADASSVLYNAMIHPLAPFDLAGVIWYQGESNTANPYVYRRLFPAMIESWRDAWGKDFPFYFVQIAPYRYGQPMRGALVREAQLQALSTPKTGM